MGVGLIREVLNTPTPALNYAERLLLLVLAETARDATRIAMPGQDAMMRGTGMPKTTLTRSLGKLCDVGAIERIALGTNRRGEPVFAHPRRRAEYRILKQPPATTTAADESAQPVAETHRGRSTANDLGSAGGPLMVPTGGTHTAANGSHLEQEWVPPAVGMGPAGGTPSVITRQRTPVNARARDGSDGRLLRLVAEKVEEMTGRSTSEEHAARVVRQILEGRSVRDPERYVLSSIQNDRDPSRFAETPQPPRYVPHPERTA